MKQLWTNLKHALKVIGDFQARLIMSVLYYILFAPVGAIMRLFSDPLMMKKGSGPRWTDKHLPDATIQAAKQQY